MLSTLCASTYVAAYNLLTARLLEKDGRYGIPKIYEGMGRLEVATLPGLTIDLDAVFQKPASTS